jgi:hypothetical protein
VSTAVKPQPIGSSWKAPVVRIGMIVHWFNDDAIDQIPMAAIVNSIGHRSIGLSIVNPQSYNFMVRDGVRHRSDPLIRSEDMTDNGVWDHTPETMLLQELLAQMASKKD